jgi:uncharacterized protein YndB with AHSA1/START domain
MIATIEEKLELEQPPETVWAALTDPAQLASWFGETAEFAAELGGEADTPLDELVELLGSS